MMTRSLGFSLFALLLLMPAGPASAEPTATFLYPLSNFSGPVLSLWAQLAVDRERNEVYALNQRANDIRIFDDHGMEIFVFGEGFASARDIAVGKDGDIFILSTGYKTATVHLLNYRGEHVSEIPLQNVPAAFSDFVEDRLVYSDGALYLVDSDSLLVIVVDEKGVFKAGYDLNTILRPILPRDDRPDRTIEDVDWAEDALEFIDVNGFSVDEQGNMLFTVPVLFSAFRLSPAGELEQFGRPGSGPGKFGVAAGIATDDAGYIYVTDRLRSVVLIFDPGLTFQSEFGYRGGRQSNLIVPDDLAIDRNGKVYVAQAANRGVSVFRVVHEAVVHETAFDVGTAGDSVAGEESSPPKGMDGSSKLSEKSDRTGEEDGSDQLESIVDVSDQVEFSVDQGGNAPSTDSGPSGWTIEEGEADHLEENSR